MTDSQPQTDDRRLDAFVALITTVHGEHITAEHAPRLRDAARALREAIAELYAYPLTNADEPDPVFAAYRADG